MNALQQSLDECGNLNTGLAKENERLKKKLEECEAKHASRFAGVQVDRRRGRLGFVSETAFFFGMVLA